MKFFWATAAAFMLLIAGSTHAQNVSVRNLPPPGAFEVVSEGGEVSLSSRVEVQLFSNGTWGKVAHVQLMRDCNSPPIPACVTLHDGEHLQPPPWSGYTCGSQCSEGCRANIVLPPGMFRFVVALCSSGESIAGPAFDMEEPREPAQRTGSPRRK